MKSNTGTTIATYALLCLAGAVSFMMPESLSVPTMTAAAVGPGQVVVNGVIRDFTKDHPDFGISTQGHFASQVMDWLPGDRRPLLIEGEGRKVDAQWRDSTSRPIAPHMAFRKAAQKHDTLGFRVNGTIELRDEAIIDGFNSNYGPYGVLGNFGAPALIATNSTANGAIKIESKCMLRGDVFVGPGGSPASVISNQGIITGTQQALTTAYGMPDISLPDDLSSFVPVMTIDGNKKLTGDTNPDDDSETPALHYGQLRIKSGSLLEIEGDLRILCDGDVDIDRAEIRLLPEAALTIYVDGGRVTIDNESLINTAGADTTLVSFNVLGNKPFEVKKKSHVYATLTAPASRLTVRDEGQFYGGFIGESVLIENKLSGVHIDDGNADVEMVNLALTVKEKIELEDVVIDAFDSNDGAYGGANVSSNAWITTNTIKDDHVKVKSSTIGGMILVGPGGDPDDVVKLESGGTVQGGIGNLSLPVPIPFVAPPTLGASLGDVEWVGGTQTISTNQRYKKLKLDMGAIAYIDGDITLRIDDKLELKNGSQIQLTAGSRLTVYVKKDLKLDQSSKINTDGANPQLVSIRRTSIGKNGKIELKNNSEIVAWIQGAKTELKLESGSQMYGSFAGKKVRMSGNAKLHVDIAYLTSCVDISDSDGTWGIGGNGGVTSAATFAEWFNNIIGVNQATGYSITLTDDGSGVYEYLNNDFHPIDDRLLGNEGQSHNHHFTYAVGARFTYEECGGQFVQFQGGDGAWLFIDDKLVLDLGGAGGASDQYALLDRLGLEEGQQYSFRLYYGQRRTTAAMFRLRTNLKLSSSRFVPEVTAMYD